MSLISGYSFVEPLLRSLASAQVRAKMLKAQPKIVASMTSKGMVPALKGVAECSRDAMFRFWKAIVSSGDLADAIRDFSEGRVVPVVRAKIGDTPTLEDLVTATCEAIISHTLTV